MDDTQSGQHPYELPSWELGPKGGATVTARASY